MLSELLSEKSQSTAPMIYLSTSAQTTLGEEERQETRKRFHDLCALPCINLESKKEAGREE